MTALRLNTIADVTEYPLLGAGQRGVVRVEKITEARPDSGGVVQFLGIRARALSTPAPPSPRRIECVGDSIMCGAHNERGDRADGFVFPQICAGERGGSHENSFLSWALTTKSSAAPATGW